MHRAVFVYARSNSRRLPGKALMPLGSGGPLLSIVLSRALMVGADSCALLTSNQPADDALVDTGVALGVQVVRGDPNNLVNRTIEAIDATGASHFLRVNGDSPLFSPLLAREAMNQLKRADLISNLFVRRFPYGVAVEWMSTSRYLRLAAAAFDVECEHVTAHLYRLRNEIDALSMSQARDDSPSRLAVDTRADYERLNTLVSHRDMSTVEYWELYDRFEPEPLYAHLPRSHQT